MDNPEFLTAKEVAAKLGMELFMFRSLVAKGILPQAIKISAKVQMWHTDDITAMVWMIKNKDRLRQSTPDEEEKDAE